MKKISLLVLVFLFVISFGSIVQAATIVELYNDVGSVHATSGNSQNYSHHWEYWSQGASASSGMRSGGCRVVAFSKLLAEAGVVSKTTSTFNPDIYYNWAVSGGYITSGCYENHSYGTGLIRYARDRGVTIQHSVVSLSGSNSATDVSTVMNKINEGYYVILSCGAHTAYVGRAASLSQGTPVILDSNQDWSYRPEQIQRYNGYTLNYFTNAHLFRVAGTNPVPTSATISSSQTSVPVGTKVDFTVSSNVPQGVNGCYYDLYVWDSASYHSGGEGIWVAVADNASNYTFNLSGDYYVRFRVHNSQYDLYSEPVMIHVYDKSVDLRITAGTNGSGNNVPVGGQVDFEFVTGFTQGENGCYFDMYVWNQESYLNGGEGIWAGVIGTSSSYVFNNSGIYYVRARIHNTSLDIYSEPVMIHVYDQRVDLRVTAGTNGSGNNVPVGGQVDFEFVTGYTQGVNGCYFDMYVWDQTSYTNGGEGTWVAVVGTASSYVFNDSGIYYVRARIHNTTFDIYSDPVIIHVYDQSVDLRITSGANGSGNIVPAGGQVDFEFVTGYTQGENGCYFDMYVWDQASYMNGDEGTWVAVVGTASSYVFNDSGIYYVRARVHNTTFDIYSEPVIIRVPAASMDDDFYAVIFNTEHWIPVSQVEDSTGIFLKSENNSSRQIWRFQKQNNGAYSISSCCDGKVLEMNSGVREPAAQITAHDIYRGEAYQQWFVIPCGNGSLLYNAHYAEESWVMDVQNGVTNDGSPIQINPQSGTSTQIWSIYQQDDVQLQGPILEVDPGTSLTPSVFSWNSSRGANHYNLRIFRDSVNGEDYSVWEGDSFCAVQLPAGNYIAYVEAENYHLSKSGETVSFTIPEVLISVIRYEHNDGSGLYDEEASARIMNEPVEIKSSTDERKGYQFTGWNTSPDGSGTNYTPGSMYTEDADLTLYAQWEPLSLLSLPSGLTEIAEEAFSGGGVVVVTIPDGCVSIGARAFAGCEDLAEIFIPESVTDIDDTAFDGCNDLVIWGKAGSFAELFSNENGICFYEIND